MWNVDIDCRKSWYFLLYHNIYEIFLVSSLISRSHKREDIELCVHWMYSPHLTVHRCTGCILSCLIHYSSLSALLIFLLVRLSQTIFSEISSESVLTSSCSSKVERANKFRTILLKIVSRKTAFETRPNHRYLGLHLQLLCEHSIDLETMNHCLSFPLSKWLWKKHTKEYEKQTCLSPTSVRVTKTVASVYFVRLGLECGDTVVSQSDIFQLRYYQSSVASEERRPRQPVLAWHSSQHTQGSSGHHLQYSLTQFSTISGLCTLYMRRVWT